mmetsp:Transcript_38863/g.85430  ORF Transcript_38863/g.85430 Transcript_38863/m.85430 type:complete len:221 (+) Transcript_38863:378-1040(+)
MTEEQDIYFAHAQGAHAQRASMILRGSKTAWMGIKCLLNRYHQKGQRAIYCHIERALQSVLRWATPWIGLAAGVALPRHAVMCVRTHRGLNTSALSGSGVWQHVAKERCLDHARLEERESMAKSSAVHSAAQYRRGDSAGVRQVQMLSVRVGLASARETSMVWLFLRSRVDIEAMGRGSRVWTRRTATKAMTIATMARTSAAMAIFWYVSLSSTSSLSEL